MVQKFRKFAIFMMFPLHIVLYYIEDSGNARGFFGAVIFMTLADMALSVGQLRLMTRREKSVRPFFGDFGIYCAEIAAVIAAEFLFSRVVRTSGDSFNILGASFTQNVWIAVCIVMLLACAVISMAVGAARTMLFHDDKPNKEK